MGIREGLLALFDDEPQYGDQLKTAFEASTGGVWTLTIGQLYATWISWGVTGGCRSRLGISVKSD